MFLSIKEESELSLPIGKEDGTLAEWANVSGIPESVIVRNGEAVWRGHPAGSMYMVVGIVDLTIGHGFHP